MGYRDCVDNTVDENSNIFSLIRMHWLPSARAYKTLHQQNHPVYTLPYSAVYRCALLV